jgi:hypothetical protein
MSFIIFSGIFFDVPKIFFIFADIICDYSAPFPLIPKPYYSKQ